MKAFKTDPQTQHDLAFTDALGKKSVMSLFKPATYGGKIKLSHLINNPVADIEVLDKRLKAIQYLQVNKLKIKLIKEELDFIEHYLTRGQAPEKVSKIKAVKNAFKYRLWPSNGYYIIARGTKLLVDLLNDVDGLFKQMQLQTRPVIFNEFDLLLKNLFNQPGCHIIRELKGRATLGGIETEQCDYLLRYKYLDQLKWVMDAIYYLDVYMAVADTAAEMNFAYPELLVNDGPVLELTGLFHPFLARPVPNDIGFNSALNMCFITGANMAGKSTLLKSVGIAVLLAHIGFPVPASAMRCTVFNGLFTTINLADDLNAGHSHFYAEVLRIKQVALNIGEINNLVIIFDELFRGTNVKDAYDASLAIIKALAGVKNCVFMVSTHIVEVAEQLNGINNLFFKCLSTTLKGTEAVYDYKLKDGISAERLGMKIVTDEGIIEMLNQVAI